MKRSEQASERASERGGSPFVLKFTHPSMPLAIVVEANERVCYAYLLSEGRMVSDVWLCNVTPASMQPEWTMPNARSLMPFKNPPAFGRQDVPAPDPSMFVVKWHEREGTCVGQLFVDDAIWAELGVGDRPGACVHALADGPVAKRLFTEGASR